MSSEPQWETTEHGWHAVASLSKGYQWTAYIEYVDSPYWRIWAGCMFDSLKHAQEWSFAEIAHQIERLGGDQTGATGKGAATQAPSQDPWEWLWETLSNELGHDRMSDIRAEMSQRLLAREQPVEA